MKCPTCAITTQELGDDPYLHAGLEYLRKHFGDKANVEMGLCHRCGPVVIVSEPSRECSMIVEIKPHVMEG